MIIDTHVHVFTDDRKNYPQIRDTPRAGSIPTVTEIGQTEWPLTTTELLIKMMDEAGIDRATLVQAYFVCEYDNRYAVDSARNCPKYSVLQPLFDLAQNPNIYIKTAINNIAAARDGGGTPEQLYEKLVSVFGAKRIMWRSNYPAHPKFGGIKPRLEASKKALAFLGREDQEWILGKTALEFYPCLKTKGSP